MSLPDLKTSIEKINQDRDLQFWALQFVGWSAYSLVTFFALTVWEDNVTWPHVWHILLQAALGLLCSWPLRAVFRKIFLLTLAYRIVFSSLAVCVSSLVWTAVRMQTFIWLSGESGLWGEFNKWIFGSLFVFMSWVALYFGIKYYQQAQAEHKLLEEESAKKNRERIMRLQAESSARDAQLQMLRYQLNPHFLFNALNSITSLVTIEENSKALGMIQRLSHFLRHSLDNDTVEKVTLEREIETLSLYLDIERVRFGDRLDLQFNIDDETGSALVPGLLLQPLAENSVKHAIAMREEGGSITISSSRDGDRLILEVVDTGPGMETVPASVSMDREIEESYGVGLSNLCQRLAANYGEKFEVEILDNKQEGFTVRVGLPFEVECPAESKFAIPEGLA